MDQLVPRHLVELVNRYPVGYHHGHLRVFDVNSGIIETLFYMHSIINCKDAENYKYYLKFSRMWHQSV